MSDHRPQMLPCPPACLPQSVLPTDSKQQGCHILTQTAPSRALDWQKHRLKPTDPEVETATADPGRHFM